MKVAVKKLNKYEKSDFFFVFSITLFKSKSIYDNSMILSQNVQFSLHA